MQLDKDKLIKHLEHEIEKYLPRSDISPTFSAYAESADHLLMKIKAGAFDLRVSAIDPTASPSEAAAEGGTPCPNS